MTREEAKSCIGTIEMLQRLAYNIHGVMDVIDADNCKKIIKALEQEPIIRNCFGCKYSKNNHNAGTEECHLCMWENQYTPTTKNDLGVDKFDKAINQSDLEEWIMETFSDWCEGDVRLIMNHMDEMPSVTPQEQKTGHWYRQTNDYVDYYECSECGIAMGVYDVKNYCPNCGSRNEVEE